MNILIAPDKFKDTLSADLVTKAIELGLEATGYTFNLKKSPLADGGEGSLQVINEILNLKYEKKEVFDPLWRIIEAEYLLDGDTAYIEMAKASGLQLLVESERNCLYTTSYGTGQLVLDALEKGASTVYVFVGGSATTDGGIGMSAALGYEFLDFKNNKLQTVGKNLNHIDNIAFNYQGYNHDQHKMVLVTDVKNPLFGIDGAAFVYGPQKGASKNDVIVLDNGLRNLAKIIKQFNGKQVNDIPGAGAAGGIGACALGLMDAKLQSGIETVMSIIKIDDKIKWADLIITGEGKFDRQTLAGKVVSGLIEKTKYFQKKLVVICGEDAAGLNPEELRKIGVDYLEALVNETTNREQAMEDTFNLISQRIQHIVEHFAK